MRRVDLTRDDGNATVTAAGIIAALAALLFAVAAVGGARVDAHRAQVAADLAAVAGAFSHAYGDDPCVEARRVAALNHATVEECTPDGADVVVAVLVDGASARSRAGPL